MNNFKIDDKVRCISRQVANNKVIEVGYIGKVTHVSDNGSYIAVDGQLGADNALVCSVRAFELVKESPTFDLKTSPWFIRVNSKEESTLAQKWLFSQGLLWCVGKVDEVKDIVEIGGYLTNQTIDLTVESYIMHGHNLEVKKVNCPEIKLTFKTSIESVEYPEIKTQQQVAIEELEATIELAKQQISKLKEGK